MHGAYGLLDRRNGCFRKTGCAKKCDPLLDAYLICHSDFVLCYVKINAHAIMDGLKNIAKHYRPKP